MPYLTAFAVFIDHQAVVNMSAFFIFAIYFARFLSSFENTSNSNWLLDKASIQFLSIVNHLRKSK